MLFKPEQAHRVVHQHIGVEHKQFGGRVLFLFQFDAESISLFAGKAGMSEACERDCTAFAGLVF